MKTTGKPILIFLLIIIFFLFSCEAKKPPIFSQLKTIEYQRNADDSLLVAAAQNQDTEIRLAATQSLARIQSPASKDLLMQQLKDENSNIRNWAAFGLGQLRDSLVAAFLVEQLKVETNGRVKNSLLIALGKSGINDMGMIYIPYLENDNVKVAAGAAMGLAYKAMRSALSPAAVKQLIHCYETRHHPEIKEAAAFALFRAADTEHIEILRKMLADKNTNIRYYALRGMSAVAGKLEGVVQTDGKIGDYLLENSKTDLYEMFLTAINDKEWQIRYSALLLLKFLNDPEIPEQLIQEPEKEHPYVVQGLINQFPYLKKAHAEKIVNKLQSQQDSHFQGMAMAGIAGMDPDTGLAFIKTVLGKPSQPQLYYAVQALQRLPESLIVKNKSAFLKIKDVFWLNNLYQLLGDKNLLTETEILGGLELEDMAVTTIIADYLTDHPDAAYIDPLIQAFEGFESPADAEPMIALLKALDVMDHPRVKTFFKGIQSVGKYTILFKSKNDWRNLDEPVKGTSVNLLKTEFSNVEKIPEKILMTTSRGKILIRLLPQVAPVTVKSFLSLAEQGYFNGLPFHRVVPGFVVQGGDPRGDGWGGPGYALPCEYSMLEYETGMVGMAHAGMDTGGSQFFITQMPQPHLDGRYTIWGEVAEGMTAVNTIMPYDTIEKIEFK